MGKGEPTVRELYHGTNNNILDVLYKHGLQPPSDMQASERCPVSGGKGLCTSLCNNDCQYCTERHEWNKCHMFGLGIYLADLSQKSHRYCSQPEQLPSGRRRFRMVVCSVLGTGLEVAGHLRDKDAMHDVCNVRALGHDLKDMIEPHCCAVMCWPMSPLWHEHPGLLFRFGFAPCVFFFPTAHLDRVGGRGRGRGRDETPRTKEGPGLGSNASSQRLFFCTAYSPCVEARRARERVSESRAESRE